AALFTAITAPSSAPIYTAATKHCCRTGDGVVKSCPFHLACLSDDNSEYLTPWAAHANSRRASLSSTPCKPKITETCFFLPPFGAVHSCSCVWASPSLGRSP